MMLWDVRGKGLISRICSPESLKTSATCQISFHISPSQLIKLCGPKICLFCLLSLLPSFPCWFQWLQTKTSGTEDSSPFSLWNGEKDAAVARLLKLLVQPPTATLCHEAIGAPGPSLFSHWDASNRLLTGLPTC